MTKPNIAILFGGTSGEYGISLKSAYSVIKHMDNRSFNVIMLGITPSGEWLRFTGSPEKIADDTWRNADDCVSAVISPCHKLRGLLEFNPEGVTPVIIDAAMPVLHGRQGEDGTVQGLLELAGIPVVGCGVLASALCMNKDAAHKMAAMAGIKVPRSFTLSRFDQAQALSLAQNLGYPLFIKPLRSGSSLGISLVKGPDDLAAAIELAFEYDCGVIVEEAITGFEVGCSVLGSDSGIIVGEADEIETSNDFFDFHEKYTQKHSTIHVPARIPPETALEIKDTAKRIYRALWCEGFARVDMFLTPSRDIYFNEVNTIPGLTDCSRFPNMLKAAGIDFRKMLDIVVRQAVGR